MITLDVGKTYQAKVNVTNRSSRGGQLGAATLLVEAQATLSGQVIQSVLGPAFISGQIDFSPGETRPVLLNFYIDWGDVDKQGQVQANVRTPDGTLLKNAVLDFYVRPRVKIEFTYNSPVQTVERLQVFRFAVTRKNVGGETAQLGSVGYRLEKAGASRGGTGGPATMVPGASATDGYGFSISDWFGGWYDLHAFASDPRFGIVGDVLFPQVLYVPPGVEGPPPVFDDSIGG